MVKRKIVWSWGAEDVSCLGAQGHPEQRRFSPPLKCPCAGLPCAIQPQLSAPKNHTPFRPANQFPDKQREDEKVEEEE
ncbi:uncharacterized [Tachysurus ichikawai]